MKYYLGIDLGGTNIVAGVVDQDCHIIAKNNEKTHAEKPFAELVKDIAHTAYGAVEKAGLSMENMCAVGLGTPSFINPATHLLVNAGNLHWRNVPLYDELKKYFAIPLFICNDADCAALGEALAGAARDYAHVLMVTLGTGLGGGIIIDKKIFNGCDRMGAEVGHIKLIFGGVPCSCGQRGCMEAYASATALINQTKEAIRMHPESLLMAECGGNLDKVDARTAFDAMRHGDRTAADVVNQYITYLAAGLSSLICVFRPQLIIIGGGVSNEGDTLLKPLNQKIYASTYAAAEIGVPRAVKALLGNDAGVIGAAMLAVSAT